MINRIAAGTVLATTLVAPALADAATKIDNRGFNSCAAEIEDTMTRRAGVSVASEYFLSATEDGRRYYINLNAWEDGERREFRSQCDTSPSGRRVLALSTEPGAYRLDQGRVTIDVAAR